MNDQGQTDAIYTEFDRLDHAIYFKNFMSFELSEELLPLVRSYLSNTTQFVALNGFKSVEYKANSRLPQRSVLGPLFFIIFINDIVDELERVS